MTNVLKKVVINPLINFKLRKEAREYDELQTDEELAAFYHRLLTRFEDRPFLLSFIYAMIGYSTGLSAQSLINKAEEQL